MLGQALNFDPQTTCLSVYVPLIVKVLDESAVQPSTTQPTYSMAIIQARAEAHEFITCHRAWSKEKYITKV